MPKSSDGRNRMYARLKLVVSISRCRCTRLMTLLLIHHRPGYHSCPLTKCYTILSVVFAAFCCYAFITVFRPMYGKTFVKLNSLLISNARRQTFYFVNSSEKDFHEPWRTDAPLSSSDSYTIRQKLMTNYCHKSQQAATRVSPSHIHLPAYNKTSLLRAKVANLYVDDKHKFLFCKVPKAGISNWKRIFFYLRSNDTTLFNMTDDEIHASTKYTTRVLAEYSLNEIEYRLKNYTKIIFVRHPLDRLLSAFRDKFQKQSHTNWMLFFRPHGRRIIQRYRQNSSLNSLRYGNDVQFDEFLRYVSEMSNSRMDKHWATYEQLCHPCHIHYDFIGKHETMSVDAAHLLNMWRVGVHFPTRYRSALDEFCEYTAAYAHIAPSFVDRLYDRYRTDAAMFGYAKHPVFDYRDRSLCNLTLIE